MRISPLTRAKRLGDLVRGSVGDGLELVCAPTDVRRSERFDVSANVAESGQDVEVGVICTETYATFMPTDKLTKSDRQMVDAVAYEHWEPLGAGESATLEVPADAPFSYAGKHLIFTWRVAARQRARGLDPTRAQELNVLP
jgi:hypothetical protein